MSLLMKIAIYISKMAAYTVDYTLPFEGNMTDERLAELKRMAEEYFNFLRMPYGPQMPTERARYEFVEAHLAYHARDLIDEIYRLRFGAVTTNPAYIGNVSED